MENYLREIEFAVTKTLDAVWHEHDDLNHMNYELGKMFEKVGAQFDAQRMGEIPSVSSEDLKILFGKSDEADKLRRRLLARNFAVNALSGTVLHFAKQGINISHGSLEACPNGRPIGSQALKSIIWYGRNQSFHWEEKGFDQS